MYGARDEFFPRSRFSQGETGEIGPRHFRYLRQHAAKRLGRSDDFVEHGGIRDDLAQRYILIPHPFFDLLSVLNVSSGRVPTNDIPIVISQRVVSDQEPAILSVLASEPIQQI